MLVTAWNAVWTADKGDDGVLIKDIACWSIQTMTEAGNNRRWRDGRGGSSVSEKSTRAARQGREIFVFV